MADGVLGDSRRRQNERRVDPSESAVAAKPVRVFVDVTVIASKVTTTRAARGTGSGPSLAKSSTGRSTAPRALRCSVHIRRASAEQSIGIFAGGLRRRAPCRGCATGRRVPQQDVTFALLIQGRGVHSRVVVANVQLPPRTQDQDSDQDTRASHTLANSCTPAITCGGAHHARARSAMSHRLNVARRGWRPRRDVPTPPIDISTDLRESSQRRRAADEDHDGSS